MRVLTGIDLLGIQNYVFASNRLRDVVSASWLVHWATWREGALQPWRQQVLHAGGGSALLAFDSLKEAKLFAGAYTRRVLDQAPGIDLVVTHCLGEQKRISESLQDLQILLARKKLERKPHAGSLGLGVTAACEITGLPAAYVDALDSAPISRVVETWRSEEVRRNAESRWKEISSLEPEWEFPAEIDDLGRSWGDTSLLAVVHVDLNGLGEKIYQWLSQCVRDNVDDKDVLVQYVEWSSWIDETFRGVWQYLVKRVLAAIQDEHLQGSIPRLNFRLQANKLPLRPVLLGGDDLTFLCDGRIGLDLAAAALRELSRKSCPHLGQMSACAGVAIVRAHYPFARAYELAEKLCAHAKAVRRKRNDAGSWLDWHIGGVRSGEPVSDFRDRLYRANSLLLTCRPYRLKGTPNELETWCWLSETLLGTGETGLRGPAWGRRRNKVKALASLVRQDPKAVQTALHAWQTVDEHLKLPDSLSNLELLGTRTPLLDAIELVDIHLPLGDES
ncbi:MAG: hypothetical protein NZV14_11655 [Bryobacteraceae bacterium]|nr:hypothetical protein [Bryobacteraceae bacterium]MDW8378809.1 hypothetical protein [Bryobacterales bacterium]